MQHHCRRSVFLKPHFPRGAFRKTVSSKRRFSKRFVPSLAGARVFSQLRFSSTWKRVSENSTCGKTLPCSAEFALSQRRFSEIDSLPQKRASLHECVSQSSRLHCNSFLNAQFSICYFPGNVLRANLEARFVKLHFHRGVSLKLRAGRLALATARVSPLQICNMCENFKSFPGRSGD